MAKADTGTAASEEPAPRHQLVQHHDHDGEHALVGFESEHLAVAVFVKDDVDPRTIEIALEDLTRELKHELGGRSE